MFLLLKDIRWYKSEVILEDKIKNGGNEKLMTAILRLFFKSLFVVNSPSFHGLYNRTHGLTKLA